MSSSFCFYLHNQFWFEIQLHVTYCFPTFGVCPDGQDPKSGKSPLQKPIIMDFPYVQTVKQKGKKKWTSQFLCQDRYGEYTLQKLQKMLRVDPQAHWWAPCWPICAYQVLRASWYKQIPHAAVSWWLLLCMNLHWARKNQQIRSSLLNFPILKICFIFQQCSAIASISFNCLSLLRWRVDLLQFFQHPICFHCIH